MTTRTLNHRILPILALLAFSGCKISEQSSISQPNFFKERLGNASATDVINYTEKMFIRHSYSLDRREIDNVIYYETNWRDRLPFDDEAAMGITTARNKIIITTRPYMRGETTQLLTVEFTGITEVKYGSFIDWRKESASTEATKYLSNISYELRNELLSRLRR
jgi:hypothetical protein